MLKINFLPDSDLRDFSAAVKEYESIWSSDGEKIVKVLEEVSGYSFKETFINACIYTKGGRSHPLGIKSQGTIDEKKAHLIHELGHRVILLPRINVFQKTKRQADDLEIHIMLFLILYDIFESLYGKEFADNAVEWDRTNLGGNYAKAWDEALSLKTKEERRAKFKELLAI